MNSHPCHSCIQHVSLAQKMPYAAAAKNLETLKETETPMSGLSFDRKTSFSLALLVSTCRTNLEKRKGATEVFFFPVSNSKSDFPLGLSTFTSELASLPKCKRVMPLAIVVVKKCMEILC